MNDETVAPACPDEEADTGVQGETSETSETSQELETRTAAQALGELGAEEALRLMGEVIAQYPRWFRYNPSGDLGGCYNSANPQVPEYDPRRYTGCLVARVLELSGRVTAQELQLHALGSWRTWGHLMTPWAKLLLGTAQSMQDQGETWHATYERCCQIRMLGREVGLVSGLDR